MHFDMNFGEDVIYIDASFDVLPGVMVHAPYEQLNEHPYEQLNDGYNGQGYQNLIRYLLS